MKTKLLLTAFLLACTISHQAIAQSVGYYKSNGTGGGAWNNAATWLIFDGTAYVPATAAPTSTSIIKVQARDSVVITAIEIISGLSVDSTASVTVAMGQALTLNSDITVNGGFIVNGTLNCGTNTVAGKGRFRLNAGASIYIGSPNGITISGATGNIQTATRFFSPAANYTYTSPAAQVTGNGLPTSITGTITDNNTNAASGLKLSQNISIKSPGSFVVPKSCVLNCKGATALTGSGSFLLSSGAVLYVGHAAGISTNPSTGAIQVTGSKTFSADANYIYNGNTAQVIGNALPEPLTGVLTIANTHPDGCMLSDTITVNAPGRVQVTGAFSCAAFSVTGTGTFTLNAGATLLTGHPSGLSATGSYGSIQTSLINYNSAANYVYNGAIAQSTGDGLPASVNNLAINDTSVGGVSLTNDITITNNLVLTAGILCLDGKTITIGALKTITRQNGTLSLCGGNLVYGGKVNVTYTSTVDISPATEMPTNSTLLNNLTVALAPGKTLTLTSPVTINGSVFMNSGLFVPGSYLTYAPNAALVYNSALPQIVGAEWPDSALNVNISIQNTNATTGLVLDSDKLNYSGTLTVPSGGFFNTGNYTLSGTGNITVSPGGTFITPHAEGVSPEGAIQLTGTRTFATGSNYTFNGVVPQITGREMPLSVNNLTINNTGVNRVVILTNTGTGTQTITGTLALTSGVFDLITNKMNLIFHSGNIPITRTTGRIWAAPVTSLQFGITGKTGGGAFTLPNDVFSGTTAVLGNVVINRTNPLTLGNQSLILNGTLQLQSGILDIGRTTLTLQNNDMPVQVSSGSLTVGAQASLQFGSADHQNGAAFTLPDHLFTTSPKFANLTINRKSNLTLGAQSITLTGILALENGTLEIGADSLNLQGNLVSTGGMLKGGKTSSLIIGGTSNSLTLPAIENGLRDLTVLRPAIGNVPAITLGADLHIESLLDLRGSSLALDTYNLILGDAAVILNADAEHFIITANNARKGGYLMRSVGKEPIVFPVGTSAYTPAFITTDSLRQFRVRAFDGIQASDTSGITYTHSNDAVNKTWIIEKVVKDSSKATVTLQWNAGDENASFDRKKSFISILGAAEWDTTAASSAQDLGNGNYSLTRTAVSQFSRFSVQEDRTILLAKWLSFSAGKQDQDILLKWTVGYGKKVSRFIIERSANGVSFNAIGEVMADSINNIVNYTFSDLSPLPFQTNYYRLKQVMTDGQFAYSERVKIAPDRVIGTIVYPVPVEDQLHIALYAVRPGPVAVYMIDISGRLVKKQWVHLKRGNSVITVPMQDLPKGAYVVQVIGDGVLYDSHKILK